MSYITCTCFFVLYEACRELEDPFLYEPNELPLLRWQSQFNEMMLAVASTLRSRDVAKETNDSKVRSASGWVYVCVYLCISV